MKIRLIRIGNSRRVRIPKTLLEQTRLTEDVRIEAQADAIVIYSAHPPRADWEAAFRRMTQHADDVLIDEVKGSSCDETEWEW